MTNAANTEAKKCLRLDAALCLVVAALAAWAIARHPYGYFQILRIVACIAAAYMAWRLYISGLRLFAVIFGVIAILFNPLIPIYLSRSTWRPIDIGTALIFVVGAFLTTRFKSLN